MKARELSLDIIKEPAVELRTLVRKERLEELAESMENKGLINPIGVIPRGEMYEIISGHRRYLAAKMQGWQEIEAIIRDIDEDEIHWERLHENMYREDISPLDQAQYFQYLVEEEDATHQEIADAIGRSRPYVTRRLLALDWPEELREALKYDQVNFRQARELARVDDEDALYRFIRQAMRNNTPSKQIHKWVERHNKYEEHLQRRESDNTKTPRPDPELSVEEARENATDARMKSQIAQNARQENAECSICGEMHKRDKIIMLPVCNGCIGMLKAASQMMEEDLEREGQAQGSGWGDDGW